MEKIVYYAQSQMDNKCKLYLNITNRCPNSCKMCIRTRTHLFRGLDLWLDREPSVDEIVTAAGKQLYFAGDTRIDVVFCGYGEPSERLDAVLAVSKRLSEDYNVNIRVNTNAHGFVNAWLKDDQLIQKVKESGISRLSVSLNAETAEKYQELCRPTTDIKYADILDFIRACKEKELPVQLTFVDYSVLGITPPFDKEACQSLADELGFPAVFREFRTT